MRFTGNLKDFMVNAEFVDEDGKTVWRRTDVRKLVAEGRLESIRDTQNRKERRAYEEGVRAGTEEAAQKAACEATRQARIRQEVARDKEAENVSTSTTPLARGAAPPRPVPGPAGSAGANPAGTPRADAANTAADAPAEPADAPGGEG